jgi:drug/metabolite transporter (DMT)-like permease
MRPEIMALLAAACWATASTFSVGPTQRLGAIGFSRLRMAFATLLLWTLALASGGWHSLHPSAMGLLAASGLIGIFIGDTALFACMNRLGPRRSGVLFACHALFSALLAWVWLGEVLWGWALFGSLMLMAGVMIAILWGKRSVESHLWEQTKGSLAVGVALGLTAALCQSLATLMLKPLMTTGIDPIAASAVRTSLALLAHLALWFSGWKPARAGGPITLRDAGWVFLGAAIAMVLGMTLILKALHEGQAGVVAIFSSVSPIVILPLLWLIYRRRPAFGAWMGASLAITGTALILSHP